MAKKRAAAARMEEVTDLQSEPTTPKGFDVLGGLIFVTLIALLAGVVLGQYALDKYFGAGLLS